jgi:hypothetical protein
MADGLVEAPRFVAVVPGEERVLEPAEVSGQVVDVAELVVVSAEGAFDASVALRVVEPVEEWVSRSSPTVFMKSPRNSAPPPDWIAWIGHSCCPFRRELSRLLDGQIVWPPQASEVRFW